MSSPSSASGRGRCRASCSGGRACRGGIGSRTPTASRWRHAPVLRWRHRGLIGVGTKPAARRRGIGRLVTLLPLKRSGEEVAGFFASEEGMHLYRAPGLQEDGWVSRWLGGL
jgi:hypothetical protein